MTKRVVVVIALLVAAVGGVLLWKTRKGGDTPATSTVTQAVGSSAAKVAPTGSNLADTPARATITVTSDKGPVADAIVRLAPELGDVVVVKTGADGVARADKLTPGEWSISASAIGFEPAVLPERELAANEDANLALTLVAGGRVLSGVVTDVSGGPIAGARIDAAKLGGMARPGRAVASVITAADGKYQLTIAEGQVLVAASSPDYAAQARYVEVGAAGATADFSLVPGGVIEGVVRDEKTKVPVAGALVDARRDGGGTMMLAEGSGHRAISGLDGRFRLGGLRPGAYELGARAETRFSKSETVVGIGVAEQVTDVELLVGVGPVIRGVVVDDTGAVVPDIDVSASTRGRGSSERSDANGAFVLAGLRPGDYFLMASNDSFVPLGGTQVTLADKDLDNVKVTVRRGLKIVGHVEPRQICEVSHDIEDRELGHGMPMLVEPTITGPDGVFELGPATGGKAFVRARCPGGDHGSMPIEVKAGMADVILAVKPGASIAGRVTDGEGKPVAGATVMAASDDGAQRTMVVNGMVTSGVQGLTGATGAYELKGLAAGAYRMSVLDRGRPLRVPEGKQVRVTLGATEKKTGVNLQVDRPNGVIKGVVTGPDGSPLADAWVSVQQDFDSMIESMVGGSRGERPRGGDGEGDDEEGGSRTVTIEARDDGPDGGGNGGFPPALTDAQGRFEIRGLPHATFEVVAEAQAGKLRGRVPNIKPDATVAIQARGLTTLSGTVRGPAGPSALFTVELEGPTTATRTFTGGSFELGRVDPGAYTVKVTSRDGNAEAKVTVIAGQPATVDITLAPNAIVIGKVVDSTGKPASDLGVALSPDAGDGRVSLRIEGMPPTTAADGTFRLESKAGTYILFVMTPGSPFTKKGLALEPGKTLDVGELRLEPPKSPR